MRSQEEEPRTSESIIKFRNLCVVRCLDNTASPIERGRVLTSERASRMVPAEGRRRAGKEKALEGAASALLLLNRRKKTHTTNAEK